MLLVAESRHYPAREHYCVIVAYLGVERDSVSKY